MGKTKISMTIAGSDSGAGAGIQADLKTFAALNVYGTSVITAVTAQNTVGVSDFEIMNNKIIASQFNALISDIYPDSIKIGMLGNEEVVSLISVLLSSVKNTPIVLDPVMVAKSGDQLISDSAIEIMKNNLIPLSTVLTPNIPESEVLADMKINSKSDMLIASKKILELGPDYLLMKGGHMEGDPIDILFNQEKGLLLELPQKRINTKNTHGTGCTFSSAITAELAKGQNYINSVKIAQKYVYSAIKTSVELGKGHGPLNHFYKSSN